MEVSGQTLTIRLPLRGIVIEIRKDKAMIDPIAPAMAHPAKTSHGGRAVSDPALMAVANEFEAVFLAEMLSHTSIGTTSESFGGGVGEDAFASLLTREWANHITKRGGVGLSEQIYQSLTARKGDHV